MNIWAVWRTGWLKKARFLKLSSGPQFRTHWLSYGEVSQLQLCEHGGTADAQRMSSYLILGQQGVANTCEQHHGYEKWDEASRRHVEEMADYRRPNFSGC